MSQFDNSITQRGTIIDISYADLAGANLGQRPDLLVLNGATYRTPDSKLYSELKGQLVPAVALRSTILAQSAIPVILVQNGRLGPGGTLILGSTNAGTMTFSGGTGLTTGSTGVTATASIAAFFGSSSDVGMVLTMSDGSRAQITSFVSSTVATCTILTTVLGTAYATNTWFLANPLSTTYANCWVYLPASATASGVAGLYHGVPTSPTQIPVNTTYANPAQAFIPYVPTVLGANLVGTGAVFSQTLSTDMTLVNITVPGGWLGPSGSLRFQTYGTQNNNANAKTMAVKFGGVLLVGSAGASNGSVNIDGRLKNRSLTSQVSHEVRGAIAGLGAIYSSVNTALDQSFTVTALIAAGSDYMVIEDFTLELLPG